MLYDGKLFLIGDHVRISNGVLKGLTAVISGFGSRGNPILCVDGFFNVMVGLQHIKPLVSLVNAYAHN